jgi:hypothetical protein
MHDIAQAALVIYQRALDDLDAALADLPDAALDWAPTPQGTNSALVLTRHGISASAYMIGCAAGRNPDRNAYLREDRPAAFASRGATIAGLRAEVAAARAALPAALAPVTDASLAAPAAWSWPEGGTPAGAELLIHGAGHLREHVGQVQLMRDLWLDRHGRA